MKDLRDVAPLSVEELEALDALLLERYPPPEELEEMEGSATGIFNLHMLDGFFAALHCIPEMVSPGRWLEVVWGDFPPLFEDSGAADEKVTLLLRFFNEVGERLGECDYVPLCNETALEEEGAGAGEFPRQEHVQWAVGFCMGLNLSEEASHYLYDDIAEMPPEVEGMLEFVSSVALLASDEQEQARKALDTIPLQEEEMVEAFDLVAPGLYSYWRDEGHSLADEASVQGTVRRQGPKIGRNDPCPCGSGRKYKKCCLQ